MTDFILWNTTFSSIIRVSIHGRMWLWTWNFLVQLQTFMNTYLDGEGGVFMEKSYTKIYTCLLYTSGEYSAVWAGFPFAHAAASFAGSGGAVPAVGACVLSLIHI